MRDSKEFRERFAAWKKGKDVYKDGRPIDLYLDTMEGVARKNAENWGVSEDEALLHAMNDNSYNYQDYYDKYPESAADSRSHWTDEFKTVYHPTFSNESRYHGKLSKYNPYGLRGGIWIGDKYIPAPWQSKSKAFRLNKLGYAKGKDAEYWDAVKDFVAQYEGFKDTTYLDGKGIPTIGYGFTDPTLTKRGKISRSEADKYFIDRLKKEDNILRDTLTNWDQLGTDAKKALISYRYNYPAGFKDTTNFIKYWNAGDYMNAIKEVDAGWNDTANPGLRIRREAEQALLKADPFLSGKVNASVPIEDPASLTFSKPAPPLDFTAPRVSTNVNQPFRKVAANNQVNTTAGWKALNHFETLDILKDLDKGYNWKLPKLPPLFPLDANQWTKSLIGYRGGKDGDYIYEGRTLPEVTVYPTTLTLRTHYPIISNYLPGHSELFGYDDSTGRYFSISKRPDNAGYNFITNNCSDDTRKALEAATGNAIRPFLFTTPGDVQDFFRLQYPNSKERWYNGVRTLKANVSLAEFNKAKEIADSLSAVNYEKRRKDAEKWRLEHLKTLSKYIKGKDSLPGYVTGEDGGFLNWLKNAVIGASVADAPAVATASGWHNEDGQWRLNRTAADEDLGRRLVDISMMSPTNPVTAALDGAFRLAAKGVKLALPGVKLALYKIHPRVKQNTIDIPEFNFDFPQDNLPELSYDASIDDIILYAADNNTTIDFPTYPELLSKWKSEAINAERRAMDFYKNDVIPRTKNVLDFWIRDFGEIDKPNMNVYYNKFEEYPHDPFHTFAVLHSPKKIIDIGKNESKYLGFANQDGMTIIKQKDWLKDLDDTIVHEGEHALRYNIGIDALISKNRQINDPDTRKIINTLAKSGKISTVDYAYSPSEIRALDDAYLFTSDFLKENKIHLIAEKGATNRELRYKISKMNNYAVGSDLDAIIDKMSTKDIISLLENGNGYSRNFLLKINNQIDNLVTYNKYSREDAYKEIWNKYRFNIKRALKTVPVGTGVAATTKKQLK